MERVTDPETASEAWRAAILPLNYTRVLYGGDNESRTRVQTLHFGLQCLSKPFYPLGAIIQNRTEIFRATV